MCDLYIFFNCMHYFLVEKNMMFMCAAYIWRFFAPVFNCSTIWIRVKLESSTHALPANSDAFWLLAFHVVFVLFLISLLSEYASVLGEANVSVTCYLDFFFSASGVWLVGSECKVPRECSSGDGGTASTSLMPGVGGIQLGRYTMESKTEDGDASGRLSQDSALFSGSCIPAISVIISK